jgi:hypothetical protein
MPWVKWRNSTGSSAATRSLPEAKQNHAPSAGNPASGWTRCLPQKALNLAHPIQSPLTKMNSTITHESELLNGIMADLGVTYALSPYHRIGFEIDDARIQKLAEHYEDRIFRSRKWFEHERLSWTTLVLRFEEDAFVAAHGDGRNYAEIVAPTAKQLNALQTEVQRVLHGLDKPKQPAFYMLRFDCGDLSADPIENVPEVARMNFCSSVMARTSSRGSPGSRKRRHLAPAD